MNILFSGIGGVGGYYGGVMAAHYKDVAGVDISFFARGRHLETIRRDGLTVRFPGGEFKAFPAVATDKAEDAGPADYIFLATKTYNLDENLDQLAPVVSPDTVLIPLLNGVDNVSRIASRFPEAGVWGGCTYIVTRREAPGLVCKYSERDSLWFGNAGASSERQDALEKLFRDAGINCTATAEIGLRLWKKFMLTSTGGTLTSYYDTCIGDVLKYHKDVFVGLAREVQVLAAAHGYMLPEDAPE